MGYIDELLVIPYPNNKLNILNVRVKDTVNDGDVLINVESNLNIQDLIDIYEMLTADISIHDIKEIKENYGLKVLDRQLDNYSYHGDLVYCSNCMKLIFVDSYKDACPCCKESETLIDVKQEVTLNELSDIGMIIKY